MKEHLSSAHLKSLSRGQLLGRYGAAISAELAVQVILTAAALLCSALTDQSTLAGLALAGLVSFLLEVLSGIFYVGLTRFYLNLVCDRPYRTSDVFSGFRSHADRVIAVRFLISVMQLLSMLPFLVCLFFYTDSPSAALFFLLCVFAVLAFAVSIYIELLYSQVYYLILDFPAYGVRHILSLSRRIMKGNKGRLLYLYVSLIPWYLAAFLSCGVALLWIMPYQRVILTNFYLDLLLSCSQPGNAV